MLVSILSVLFLSFVFLPVAGSIPVNILPPGGNPHGLPYADHIENFWKWALAIPAKDNPINDPTGEKCASGQSNTNSSVFYLSGNNGGKSERTCIVPAGKGLFIPVMQMEVSDKEAPNSTLEDLKLAAKTDQDSVNSLYLKVGDKEYNFDDLRKYRMNTDIFEVDYADNGLFGVTEGGPSKGCSGWLLYSD